MNIIEHGDYKKACAEKRKKDIKRFRCPICGALWEASISKKECRIAIQDSNDDRWISDCPEEWCEGSGKEEDSVSCYEIDCANCVNGKCCINYKRQPDEAVCKEWVRS